MGRRKKSFGGSFSWRRASGLSATKGKVSRAIGVPLTRSGRQKKVGRALGCSVIIALLVLPPALLAGTYYFL